MECRGGHTYIHTDGQSDQLLWVHELLYATKNKNKNKTTRQCALRHISVSYQSNLQGKIAAGNARILLISFSVKIKLARYLIYWTLNMKQLNFLSQLRNCICDGSELFDCQNIRANMERWDNFLPWNHRNYIYLYF